MKAIKKIKPLKRLTLDYSKWRCGEDPSFIHPKTSLGIGWIHLLNNEGYMCCLGQFSLQLNPGLCKSDIRNIANPEELCTYVPSLTRLKNKCYINTKLSKEAIRINDDRTTTVQEKIKLLRSLFKEHGYSIRVINQPKN